MLVNRLYKWLHHTFPECRRYPPHRIQIPPVKLHPLPLLDAHALLSQTSAPVYQLHHTGHFSALFPPVPPCIHSAPDTWP